MTTRTRFLAVASVSGLLFWAAGCSSDSHLTGSDDPTTRALSDPMNYSPNDQDPNISGGNLTTFDSKAFKRDMDYVLNP